MGSDIKYIPITTEDAIAAVLEGKILVRAEIPDLRALIEGVQQDAEDPDFDPARLTIRCLSCLILKCDCRGLVVRIGLDFNSSGERKEDNSGRIEKLSKAFKQQAVFTGTVFEKGANFNDAGFAEGAFFDRAGFKGAVHFEEAIFEGEASFAGASFVQGVNFSSATYSRNADFTGVSFGHPSSFQHAVFKQGTDFAESTFSGKAHFHAAQFAEDARFVRTAFERYADFGYAKFGGEAHFSKAVFGETADFRETAFSQEAGFFRAIFERGADFQNSRFAQAARFDGATFVEISHWGSARLCGLCDFSEATVKNRLLLGNTDFESEARLDFEDIDLRPGGRIELTIDQIGRWRTHLIQGEDSHDPDELASAAAQYNMLRDNFRALPSTDAEEDRCHYKYMDLRRRSRRPPCVDHQLAWASMRTPREYVAWCRQREENRGRHDPTRGGRLLEAATHQASRWAGQTAAWLFFWGRRFCNWSLLKWCYGYGIYTHRIVASMGLVICLCAVVYAFAVAVWGPGVIKDHDGHFNAWYFSVITFTTIGYGDYAPLGWLRWIAGAEGLLGLFLMALFTVSFARKIIR